MHKRFSLRFRNVYWESSCEITGNNWKEPIFYLFSFFFRKSIESVVGNLIFYEFSFFSRFKSIFVFFIYIFRVFLWMCSFVRSPNGFILCSWCRQWPLSDCHFQHYSLCEHYYKTMYIVYTSGDEIWFLNTQLTNPWGNNCRNRVLIFRSVNFWMLILCAFCPLLFAYCFVFISFHSVWCMHNPITAIAIDIFFFSRYFAFLMKNSIQTSGS